MDGSSWASELGVGVGHSPHEYAETGIELHPAIIRKEVLAERVAIIRQLFDSKTVDWSGEHHHLSGAHIDPAGPDHLPILIGGNGDALLAHAARDAVIIGLQRLWRTLGDGHRHTVKWSTEHLDAQVAYVRASSGARINDIELNALVQIVTVTEDRAAATDARADVLGRVEGLTAAQLDAVPYVLIGPTREITEKLQMCGERWGITYFAVRELGDFAPVIHTCRSASA